MFFDVVRLCKIIALILIMSKYMFVVIDWLLFSGDLLMRGMRLAYFD